MQAHAMALREVAVLKQRLSASLRKPDELAAAEQPLADMATTAGGTGRPTSAQNGAQNGAPAALPTKQNGGSGGFPTPLRAGPWPSATNAPNGADAAAPRSALGSSRFTPGLLAPVPAPDPRLRRPPPAATAAVASPADGRQAAGRAVIRWAAAEDAPDRDETVPSLSTRARFAVEGGGGMMPAEAAEVELGLRCDSLNHPAIAVCITSQI
jgi:hypothetical protein